MALIRTLASLLASLVMTLPAAAGELKFDPVEVPAADAEKGVLRATTGATLDGRRLAIGFRPLLQGGQRYGAGVFGLTLNAKGEVVKDGTGAPVISTYPDFTSLLPVGGQLFGVSHFESLPSALYLSRFAQDRRSGALATIETRSLRLAHIGGVYNPCAGMITPWGTHLGAEEYPADVRNFEVAVAAQDKTRLARWVPRKLRYFGINPEAPDFAAIKAAFKPYRYGFPFEVRVRGWGQVDVVRRHAMGRFSHEVAYVMPDRRTVYMSDDGDNAGFFMFIADRPGDLSAGRLFAARWEQTSPAGSAQATANLGWVDLGHATSAAIVQAIEANTSFSDLFETAPITGEGQCPGGFTPANFVGDTERRAGECLKVKPQKEIVASRLETRRYAAMKGATTEFNKAEGLTFDPNRKRLYASMTAIDRGMGDGTEKGKPSDRFERGGPNHVRLAFNPCGVVLSMDLARDDRIGSDWVARTAAPLLTGTPDPKAVEGQMNFCALDGIANPDNLTFIPEHDILVIAEDSDGGHENDAIWALDVGRGTMTRILTVPQGAEASGVYWHPNINGYAYLTAIAQHPFGDSVEKRGIKPPSDDPKHRAAVVGVIGPFPAVRPAVAGKK